MATASLGRVLHHLRRLAGTPGAPASDAQLLQRFAQFRDEAAFTALVERHGPLVLGVCRRVLKNEHDAEDAFQATFLVLARKAAAVSWRTSVAAWLHTVAYRLALRARAAAACRKLHERQAAQMSRAEVSAEDAGEDLRAVLDEELGRLPEKYRAPLVLCYLEDQSHAEAARELGWPAGSMSMRLARGRELLRRRLERRGVTLAGGATPGLVMPPALAQATVRSAVLFTGGTASGPAAALATGMLQSMLFTRLQVMAAAALLLSAVVGGLLAHQAWAARQGEEEPGAAAAQADDGEPADAAPARTDRYGDPLPAEAVLRLGTVRFRHGQWVRSVAFSPDGKFIASASSDHTVRLWDRATGREVRRLTGHRDAVNFVAFTADGKQLITASGYYAEVKDASVRLWDVESGREVRRFFPDEGDQPMAALALSADGKTLAAGREDSIWLAEVPSGRELGVCRRPMGKVRGVCFSHDRKSLAAAVEFVGICLFDLKTKQLVWENTDQPTDYPYRGVAFAPDGQTVAASISIKQPMRLLDAATGKVVRRFEGEHNAAAPFVFSQDGKRILSKGWGQQGIIWDVATGKPAGSLEPLLNSTLDLTLSPDGKTLAGAGDRAIRFWDAATGKGLPGPEGAQAPIETVTLSPDGKTVLTASHFDTVAGARLWELGTGKQRTALTGRDSSRCAAFAPDGKSFAVGCYNGTPAVVDVATGRILPTCEGKPQLIDSLAWSPDGKLLVGTGWHAGQGTDPVESHIRVWDPATGKELPPLGTLPRGGGAKCLAFAPDGKHLATGGMDKVIRLWDVAARKEVREFTGQEGSIWALAFAPDGQKITAVTATGTFNFGANGTDRAIRVWDVGTGRLLRRLQGPEEGSWSVAWSPDGRVLATGGEDHVIRLWEAASGGERICLAGHEGPVSALAFTADGTRLISGSSDTTALVWDLAAVGRPARPPTAEELPALWTVLAGDDTARAFRALAALASSPDRAVPLLKEKLRPVAAPEPEELARLMAGLDDPDFAVREKATRDLEALGDVAAPALKKALENNPSPELRRRAERLLEALVALTADRRRALRAVEVLERIGSPEARRLLEALSRGAPGARETREALAALERLARRTVSSR